jgi:catechol 2,3-dioxygenase-like lactoylglutathione lyase family enzyme
MATTKIAKLEPVDLKLEVVVVGVSDLDRAKAFYQNLGWRLDADFSNGTDFRIIQVTPPRSPAAIIFGKGIVSPKPGSVTGVERFLAVGFAAAQRQTLRDTAQSMPL